MPTPAWSLIDARWPHDALVTPTSRIAGLPLIARHLRMVARQGWDGAVIEVSDVAAQREIEAAIATRPPPPSLTVEYLVDGRSPTPRSYVELDGSAIYSADELSRAATHSLAPEPLARPTTAAEVARAERTLARLIRKNIDQDGAVSVVAFRPISRQMTRLVLDTGVTPNQVSIAAMAFGIAAAVIAGFGGYYPVMIAGLLYWVGAVVDCVDGEIARLRIEGSKAGEWLDTLADDVSTYGLLAGLGVGLVSDGYDPLWNLVGIGGAALGFLLQAKLYADLHRWNMTIDTAQYPWFFGAPSNGGEQERGLVATIFYVIAFLFRRDAFVTIIAILLICDLRQLATALLASGVVIVLGLFLIHTLVTAVRGQSS